MMRSLIASLVLCFVPHVFAVFNKSAEARSLELSPAKQSCLDQCLDKAILSLCLSTDDWYCRCHDAVRTSITQRWTRCSKARCNVLEPAEHSNPESRIYDGALEDENNFHLQARQVPTSAFFPALSSLGLPSASYASFVSENPGVGSAVASALSELTHTTGGTTSAISTAGVHTSRAETGGGAVETGASSSSDAGGANDGGGLSTGAKAGIGVGCGILGLALITAAGWFVYRTGRKKKSSGDSNPPGSEGIVGVAGPEHSDHSPTAGGYYTEKNDAYSSAYGYRRSPPGDGAVQEGRYEAESALRYQTNSAGPYEADSAARYEADSTQRHEVEGKQHYELPGHYDIGTWHDPAELGRQSIKMR